MKLITLLKLLLISCLIISAATFADEIKPWPVVIQSGKGEQVVTITQTMPLPALTKSIYKLNHYEVEDSSLDTTKQIKITYVGKVSGSKVYDLIYPLTSSYYSHLKVIVMERKPNLYVPVFYDFLDGCRYPAPLPDNIKGSFVVPTNHLIASEIPLGGNGGNIDGFYVYIPPDILQDENATPKIFHIGKIYRMVEEKLPKGFRAVDGYEGFDVKTLHFNGCVIKETESHCFDGENYGAVDARFKLDNGELQVISFKYQPERPKYQPELRTLKINLMKTNT